MGSGFSLNVVRGDYALVQQKLMSTGHSYHHMKVENIPPRALKAWAISANGYGFAAHLVKGERFEALGCALAVALDAIVLNAQLFVGHHSSPCGYARYTVQGNTKSLNCSINVGYVDTTWPEQQMSPARIFRHVTNRPQF